ncbi:MAG: GerMN domain-containing protein [Spirochaetia bacterium]|nr:GerMN domain-containing protein [Spirochaetia bacterium]
MFSTEQMNRIVLMMAGLLMLLVFMDHQARRHNGNQFSMGSGDYLPPSGKLNQKLEQAVDSIQSPLEPIRAPLEEILNTPAEKLPIVNSTYNNPSTTRIKLRSLETSTVDLYFIRFKSSDSEIVRVRRSVPNSDISIYALVNLLQKGPLPEERGLLNAFDEKIRVHSAVLENGIVTIDADEAIGAMGAHVIHDRLAQISLTLFQFPEVQGIRLFVNGRPVSSLGSAKVKIPAIMAMPDRKISFYP